MPANVDGFIIEPRLPRDLNRRTALLTCAIIPTIQPSNPACQALLDAAIGCGIIATEVEEVWRGRSQKERPLPAKQMPWTKTSRRNSRGARLYRSPSGRMFTLKQIRAYKATKGFSRPVRAKRRK
jgi:hypothetical protein